MKRKYWIEAGAAAAVLVAILAMMVPVFHRAQIRARMQSVQNLLDNAVLAIDQTPDWKERIQSIHSFKEEHIQGLNPDGSLLFYWYGRVDVDPVQFAEQFPEVEAPVWTDNDLFFELEWIYCLKNSIRKTGKLKTVQTTSKYNEIFEYSSVKRDWFEDRPFIVNATVRVGRNLGTNSHRPFMVLPQPSGYFELIDHSIAYDISNGLDSYGEFLSSSYAIHPKKKAIFMVPPPEEK
ncbi:hypothetical protein K8I31_22280 [bacterium]|nr:hypothetical protein [bacterium]